MEKGQSYRESLRGVWSGVRVGCLPLKSTDRQMDRQKVQREMAKEHVEEVKGEEGTGTGQGVPLIQTHVPSCSLVPRKEGVAARPELG